MAQPKPASDECTPRAVLLFEEARRMIDRGDYKEALPKLEESYHLCPFSETLYWQSVVYERLGSYVRAWDPMCQGSCRPLSPAVWPAGERRS